MYINVYMWGGGGGVIGRGGVWGVRGSMWKKTSFKRSNMINDEFGITPMISSNFNCPRNYNFLLREFFDFYIIHPCFFLICHYVNILCKPMYRSLAASVVHPGRNNNWRVIVIPKMTQLTPCIPKRDSQFGQSGEAELIWEFCLQNVGGNTLPV